jgi:hypothetical protein
MTQDVWVATEICSETGSWLRDQQLCGVVDGLSERQLIALLQPQLASRNGIAAKTLRPFAEVTFEKFVVRKRSMIEASVSYPLHTNRELRLMLDGKKNFAFLSKHRSEPKFHFGLQRFNAEWPSISRGDIQASDSDYRIYFTSDGEAKVERFVEHLKREARDGASEASEIELGQILGYSEEQNKEYIEKFWNARNLRNC